MKKRTTKAKRPMTLPALKKALEIHAKRIAASRDALRDLQDEIENLLDPASRACEDLDSAIGALSEVV